MTLLPKSVWLLFSSLLMDLGGPGRLRLILLPLIIGRDIEEFPISPCSVLLTPVFLSTAVVFLALAAVLSLSSVAV